MPIHTEESKTPAGRRIMLARVNGKVSLQDAKSMGDQLKPGQPYHGSLVLCVVDKTTDYHPKGRRHFATFNDNYKRLAIVVTSPLLRGAINFMLRVTGKTLATQMFPTEEQAQAWLDE